jgi:four helix bundle protein
MEEIENFRKLKVWEKAHGLVINVYKNTENFPKSEMYGLVSQMRRAAVSIVANIVEGTKRKTSKDRKHFLVMSDTSLEELKYYFILSYQLQYIDVSKAQKLTEQSREVGRMLNGFTKSIK